MDEKRAKNLCFWCDERFVPRHKCSRRQAFLIEVEAVEEGQDEVMKEELEETPSPHISLHALLGTRSCQTMRVVGIMGKRLLHILVDSGSTHNFLNEEVGRKLGCQTELMSAVRVAVANGNELKCERVCKKFRWRMQGKEYVADMLLLPLESYDMVLGVQWLATLGDILWNFRELQMKFVVDGKDIVLQGKNSEELKTIREEQMEKLLQKKNQLDTVQLCTLELACTSKVQLSSSEAVGVSTDPKKLKAVQEWLVPMTVKQLRGFMGLTSYYRRFVRNYGSISKPLTELLKKDSFLWSEVAQEAFDRLKQAMITTPVLALLDFSREFVIETDASGLGIGAVLQQGGHPLAYISKRLNTPLQHTWLAKLLGYDYEIGYKKGKENVVADALSRILGQELHCMALFVVSTNFFDRIQASWSTYLKTRQLLSELKENLELHPKFTWNGEQLRRKGKIVVGNDTSLQQDIMAAYHSSSVGGHSGNQAMAKRIASLLYWKGMWRQVKQFVRDCKVCQQNKVEHLAYPGLLQPLPMPRSVFTDITMDFIEGLPKSRGKEGVELLASTVYHPQTDGQSEAVNKCLETYLRCMTGDKPTKWAQWISLAEWWYNTTYHNSTGRTPFEALYGFQPPINMPYLPHDSTVAAVDSYMTDREGMIKTLKYHLKRAQDRMKTQADKKRTEREFAIGDWVYMKLQPYRQGTVANRPSEKLSPSFFGPFQVIDRIRKVAYRLKLPTSAQIHPIFHVSQLKKAIGSTNCSTELPTPDNVSGDANKQPSAILERRLVRRGNKAAAQVLVHWTNTSPTEATWEYTDELRWRFPQFDLEGKGSEGEGNVVG
ncbi:hypothetical protein CRG98_017758 [Punica granatum]|uniref:Integrase catalytic domain-containing protein n=1 Tax=Punica granatum TaxID=22663 RepID=A0A2I0K176_PUNGR|nr:hypothetical protein CRG98_017758 [Punica granatum]